MTNSKKRKHAESNTQHHPNKLAKAANGKQIPTNAPAMKTPIVITRKVDDNEGNTADDEDDGDEDEGDEDAIMRYEKMHDEVQRDRQVIFTYCCLLFCLFTGR